MDKAFLFDLDGTLLNTLDDIADAMNYALREAGIRPWERDAYRYMVGNGARILAERAVRDRADLTEHVLAVYQERYSAHRMDRTRPYPGIPEALAELAEKGIPLCVLSNKPDADTRAIIARAFPEIPFAHVQGQRPEVPRKPDPAGALGIAEKLGIPPERFLYAGDTSVDMECARRAGMRAVGVLWGFRTETELRGSGADELIRKPGEMVTLAVAGMPKM